MIVRTPNLAGDFEKSALMKRFAIHDDPIHIEDDCFQRHRKYAAYYLLSTHVHYG